MADQDYFVGQTLVVVTGCVGSEGTVTRVGRSLVDIAYRESPNGRSFYKETREAKGPAYGYGTIFRTLEEQALVDRRLRALVTMREHKIFVELRAEALPLWKLEAIVEILLKEDG